MSSSRTQAESSGQRPNDDAVEPDLVLHAEQDIATNELLEKIIVGVPGRRRLQKIYVRTNAKGSKTTNPYNPEADAPAPHLLIPILPTKEEIESRTETMEFLVVGLVLALDPAKYSTKASGKSRDKQRVVDREARGVLPKETNVLRAIVPVTDNIASASIKYYVACHQTHGLCNMRVISSDKIFYFAEIWEKVDANKNVKTRRGDLGMACKTHAARDKKPPQRAVVTISASRNSTPSNVLSITPSVNAANQILMQYSVSMLSSDPASIHALKKTLENILPDLLKKPTDEGVLAFYDFEDDLDLDDAKRAIESVQETYPNLQALSPAMSPDIVITLHSALRRKRLGGKLPYQSFVHFLRIGHDRVHEAMSDGDVEKAVADIIHDIEIFNEIQAITSSRTTSKIEKGEGDLTLLLRAVHLALEEIVRFWSAQAQELREQHGGITNHASIEDLMNKIANCVDRTALKALNEQVFAIHAEQLATANSTGAEHIQKLIALIEEALASTS